MSIKQQLEGVRPESDTALAIGTFDGVHRGHQRLFQLLLEASGRLGLSATVVTFRNHPRTVLAPQSKVEYIMPWAERERCIRSQGVGAVVPLDFTLELSQLKAREFVTHLVRDLRMKLLVAGPDFALGHRREGDVTFLKALGEEMGFEVSVVEPALLGDRPVSSRALRRLISEGDVTSAAEMLGRCPTLTGVVVEGDRRGRELGFPTANLATEQDVLVPGDGIYATWTIVKGQRFQSATSIGVRPTFEPGPRSVETFIMDFNADVYGESITLEFVSRLREEMAFSSVDALVEQMNRDVEQARHILSGKAT